VAAGHRVAPSFDAVSAIGKRGNEALLVEFGDAWNAHDIVRLIACVTDDCVFETSWGPFPYGERFQGKTALVAAFPRIWSLYPDARWDDATHVVCGDRGFSEWMFRGTDRAGRRVEVRGVDLFVFRDGSIARKDTFRKSFHVPA
jgi:ketosteroid isomerase-like protein